MRIKIGPLEYPVLIIKDLEGDDGQKLFGEFDQLGQVIRIREDATPDHQYLTLWHEVLHGLDDEYALLLGEQTVATLAMAIVQLLQDNPDLRYKNQEQGQMSTAQRRSLDDAIRRNRNGDTP